MTAKLSYKEITTEEVGVTCITADGVFVGIIYSDMKTRSKKMYKVEEMSVEEITALIQKEVDVPYMRPDTPDEIAKKGIKNQTKQ